MRLLHNLLSFKIVFVLTYFCHSISGFTSEACPEASINVNVANALNTLNDSSKAQSIYEKMLTSNTCPWQRHIITTNISSTLLEQKQWDVALSILQSIPVSENTFPVLLRQVKFNTALAYIGKAEDNIDEALQHLKHSLTLLEEVRKIDCSLSVLEKAPNCVPQDDWTMARLKIKQLLEKNYEKQRLIENQLASPIEKIRVLLKSINDNIFDLNVLQNTSSIDDSLLNEYIEAQIEQSQDTLQLIETAKKNSNINETLEALNQTVTNSKDSIEAVKTKDFAAAKSHLENSKKNLKELLSLLTSAEPIEAELQELLISYSELLNKEWLIENDILNLQNGLVDLIKTLPPESNLLLRKYVEEANTLLTASLKSLQIDEGKAAKFFLIKSFYDIQLALEAFNMPEKLTPVNLLESGVLMQQQAVNLSSLARFINLSQEISSVLTKTQRETLESLSPFVKAVLAKQYDDFNIKRQPCQDKPWNEVIPLYQKGTDAALNAESLLAAPPLNWKAIDEKQREALNDWSEALEKLKKHQKDEEEKDSQSTDKQSASKPINQTLELLEQMEQEDKTKPPHPAIDTGVKKPW